MTELQRDINYQWTGESVECSSEIHWAIEEQANGVFAIIVNSPGGILTGKQVRVLAEIVGDDGVIKNTRRMTSLLLIPKEKVDQALEKIQEVGLRVANLHKSVRNITSCPGKGFSSNSRGDTLELARLLDEEFYGTILPWDFKIGISGCPRNCTGVQCNDLGLMAEPRGKYSLWLGGKESGMDPVHGVLIRKGIPREQVIPVVRRILDTYNSKAEEHKEELGPRARLYRVIEKTGLELFKIRVEELLSN
ncbi:nitrite reductase [Desulfosporosinus hippei]|uniref:Nitrite and sulphite reductase 4Fe-4S domain-containing protein n=1 Tax=Desulfosporosinus hippei DSM 8344 TaxID=1121419 RepID=A0A1G8F2P6_9FIRM|nr:nitrite reductase [Desulfosporosinus hippei]SDH76415.1 Nitrite and sulphite reductase 4Fe-4S domain-containing protein [Desulfosporosinus hippei DSM 8344]